MRLCGSSSTCSTARFANITPSSRTWNSRTSPIPRGWEGLQSAAHPGPDGAGMSIDWCPEWFLSAFALATVFTVMFDVGLGVVPGEFLWLWRRPALMLKALFAILVAVPAVAMLVARLLDLPRAAEIGFMVMAISPGRRLRCSRSLASGGHRSFAPGLQVTVALLAVVSMPVVDCRAQPRLFGTRERRAPATHEAGVHRPVAAARSRHPGGSMRYRRAPLGSRPGSIASGKSCSACLRSSRSRASGAPCSERVRSWPQPRA